MASPGDHPPVLDEEELLQESMEDLNINHNVSKNSRFSSIKSPSKSAIPASPNRSEFESQARPGTSTAKYDRIKTYSTVSPNKLVHPQQIVNDVTSSGQPN